MSLTEHRLKRGEGRAKGKPLLSTNKNHHPVTPRPYDGIAYRSHCRRHLASHSERERRGLRIHSGRIAAREPLANRRCVLDRSLPKMPGGKISCARIHACVKDIPRIGNTRGRKISYAERGREGRRARVWAKDILSAVLNCLLHIVDRCLG